MIDLAVVKVTGALQKSTEVMKIVNRLIQLPQISNNMMELSKEMMKAGMIEEMVNDALDMDNEEIEEEAQQEVDKVLFELTDGTRLSSRFIGTSWSCWRGITNRG